MTSEVMSEGHALQYGIQIVRSGSKKLQVKLHLDLASSILEGHFVLTLTSHSQHGLRIPESHA
jgi:hypothetical protein